MKRSQTREKAGAELYWSRGYGHWAPPTQPTMCRCDMLGVPPLAFNALLCVASHPMASQLGIPKFL
ncbi:unnamed protein product, partial [Ilex paraguariensis]